MYDYWVPKETNNEYNCTSRLSNIMTWADSTIARSTYFAVKGSKRQGFLVISSTANHSIGAKRQQRRYIASPSNSDGALSYKSFRCSKIKGVREVQARERGGFIFGQPTKYEAPPKSKFHLPCYANSWKIQKLNIYCSQAHKLIQGHAFQWSKLRIDPFNVPWHGDTDERR